MKRSLANFGDEMMIDQEYLQKMRDFGVKVLPLPSSIDEALLKAAAEFYDKMSAGDPFYAEVVQSQRKFVKICESVGLR